MGIKKLGRRLEKLARKARLDLGKGGKEWVEAVYRTAIGVIEDELRKKARPARKPGASPDRRSGRPVASRSVSTESRKTGKPAVARERRPPRPRPRRVARREAPAEQLDPSLSSQESGELQPQPEQQPTP